MKPVSFYTKKVSGGGPNAYKIYSMTLKLAKSHTIHALNRVFIFQHKKTRNKAQAIAVF
jgi:hypothetical protein